MIVVKVKYTVKEAYVNANKQLIEEFLTDFRSLDSSRFLYSVFQTENDSTFVHISQYADQDIQQNILGTPSFLRFQTQRDKNLTSAPHIEVLEYIGASKDVL
ncbi:putative quinol monooxygenase [Sphingobacterium sp. SYP-B4668]|uniref:putative quinol monooxygenase n=1 Tax=Sphingobacterium sp. SYP-B4668 TaxID=2996035 RepID=UPI0022DE4995|nr:antibiotic biosynthesis monooxygenase [Sphingobacterium sp. SYP-B4668]